MKRLCKAAENFISLESIGLPKEFDEKLKQFFTGCYCVEPYDFIQYALYDIRANIGIDNYDPTDHGDDFEVFSSEEWKMIIQALIANDFVKPDFNLDPVCDILHTSVVGSLSEDVYNGSVDFFNWCYEYLGNRNDIRLNSELLEAALKVTYSPEQHRFLKWMIGNHYHYRSGEDGPIIYYDADHEEKSVPISEAEKNLAVTVYKTTRRWVVEGNFYKILEAALMF